MSSFEGQSHLSVLRQKEEELAVIDERILEVRRSVLGLSVHTSQISDGKVQIIILTHEHRMWVNATMIMK